MTAFARVDHDCLFPHRVEASELTFGSTRIHRDSNRVRIVDRDIRVFVVCPLEAFVAGEVCLGILVSRFQAAEGDIATCCSQKLMMSVSVQLCKFVFFSIPY